MRWSVIALVVVGVVAAMAAAVLVGSLKATVSSPPARPQPKLVSVLYATQSLPALTVVDPNAVESRREPLDKAPKGHIGDASQVVGRVVYYPVVKGQPFVTENFASGKTGLGLAAAVREGMRAFTLSLDPEAALSGLLYPGSVVDILASFKVPAPEGRKGEELASITILHGVHVLAIEDKTVVSQEEDEKPGAAKSSSSAARTGRRLVTLMVDPNQAEVLQLAQTNGTVSLAMRNPLEKSPGDVTATRLSQVCQLLAREPQPQTPPPALPPVVEPTTRKAVVTPPTPVWTVQVLRAGKETTENFPMPKDGE